MNSTWTHQWHHIIKACILYTGSAAQQYPIVSFKMVFIKSIELLPNFAWEVYHCEYCVELWSLGDPDSSFEYALCDSWENPHGFCIIASCAVPKSNPRCVSSRYSNQSLEFYVWFLP